MSSLFLPWTITDAPAFYDPLTLALTETVSSQPNPPLCCNYAKYNIVFHSSFSFAALQSCAHRHYTATEENGHTTNLFLFLGPRPSIYLIQKLHSLGLTSLSPVAPCHSHLCLPLACHFLGHLLIPGEEITMPVTALTLMLGMGSGTTVSLSFRDKHASLLLTQQFHSK